MKKFLATILLISLLIHQGLSLIPPTIGISIQFEDKNILQRLDLVPKPSISFPIKLSELQKILDHIKFTKDDVISDSYQSVVLRKKGTGFVIKARTTKDDEEYKILEKAYSAAQLKLGNLAARFSMNVKMRIFVGKWVDIKSAIVQEEVISLDDFIPNILSDKSLDIETKVEILKYILSKKAELDRRIQNRGIYICDLFLKQYGINTQGDVVLLDLGSSTVDPKEVVKAHDITYNYKELIGFQHRMNKRGYTLYHTAAIIIRLASEELGEQKALEIAKYYMESTGLQFSLPDEDLVNFFNVSGQEIITIVGDELAHFLPEVYNIACDSLNQLPIIASAFNLWEIFRQYCIRKKYDEELIRIAEEEYEKNFCSQGTDKDPPLKVESIIVEENTSPARRLDLDDKTASTQMNSAA